MSLSRRNGERGNALMEFALVVVFLVPLMMGTFSVGMTLGRTIQVTQVARDAGHMYARWVDFSLEANKRLLVQLADGLGMTTDGGSGVVRLSKVTYIDTPDCTGAGLSTGNCPNYQHYVIAQRQVVGNDSLYASRIGTPSPNGMDSQGNVQDVIRDTTAQATNWSDSGIVLPSGKFAFVVEVYFTNEAFQLSGVTRVDPIYIRLYF
jgi:TadE-like protein